MRALLMARLAWHDYRAEWRLSACAVLALVAVLAPLLVLFGLKSGLVGSLSERLEQDPAVREVIALGGARYSAADIAALAQLADVAFVLPRTRQIAATADLYPLRPGAVVSVEMLPTAPGDPLLASLAPPSRIDAVLLSQSAAEKLGAGVGDELVAAFGRLDGGVAQYQRTRLQVVGVLPLAAFPRDALFAQLALLEAVEDYRDGRAVAQFGWPGSDAAAGGARVYPGFRLYARDLDGVERLRRHFAAAGQAVATQAESIAQVRSLSRNLGVVFWIIAGLGLAGAFAAMTASALAAVARKRRELAVLRLIGFPTAALLAFVVLQALYSGLLSLLLAGLAYLLVEALLNQLFVQQAGEYACRLEWSQFLLAALATLLFSLLAAAAGGWRAARIEASEGLRDV